MTRSKTKQSVDSLQQMVAGILNKAQVEKDEGPEVEALLSILIVAEAQVNLKAHTKYVLFLLIIFIYSNFGPNCLEGPCLFLSFCSDTL